MFLITGLATVIISLTQLIFFESHDVTSTTMALPHYHGIATTTALPLPWHCHTNTALPMGNEWHGLKISIAKTEALVFGQRMSRTKSQYDGTQIQNVEEFEYLGSVVIVTAVQR